MFRGNVPTRPARHPPPPRGRLLIFVPRPVNWGFFRTAFPTTCATIRQSTRFLVNTRHRPPETQSVGIPMRKKFTQFDELGNVPFSRLFQSNSHFQPKVVVWFVSIKTWRLICIYQEEEYIWIKLMKTSGKTFPSDWPLRCFPSAE